MAELESKTLGRAPASLKKEEKTPRLETPVNAYVEGVLLLTGLIAATAAGFYIWLGVL